MQEREVRMRVTEALATMGVRAASAVIREAEPLVEWIMAGEDEPEGIDDTPQDEDKAASKSPRRAKRNGDKGTAPS